MEVNKGHQVSEIKINMEWCKGCRICEQLCPQKVFEVDKMGKPSPVRMDDCVYCRMCELRCPDLAITLVPLDTQRGRKAALLRCQGSLLKAPDRVFHEEKTDCRKRHYSDGGSKLCEFGCLGGGNCVDICPTGAIIMGPERLPIVYQERCTSCGLCVDACPRNLYEIHAKQIDFSVCCVNSDKAIAAKKVCAVACIKCRRCERSCPFGAIDFSSGVARIEEAKCFNCGICSSVCPNGSIADRRLRPLIGHCHIDVATCSGCGMCLAICPAECISMGASGCAVIDEDPCIGCELCRNICPQSAISSHTRATCRVVENKCTGCGECIKECPVNCIKLNGGKAVINEDTCTDCEQCRRTCKYAAIETFPSLKR